jgi:ketosteroid isomerase-like protein
MMMADTEAAPDVAREVKGVMARFGRAFSAPAVDVEGLIALWDPEYPDPVYQPEELEAPLRSWPELRAYFEGLPAQITGVSDIRPLDIRVDAAGDLAYAYVRAWGSLGVVRRDEPLEGEVRQTFVMRRRDGAWRLVHYHESRLTPGLEDAVG